MMAIPLMIAWSVIIYGFFNAGALWGLLLLPSAPLLLGTVVHISGYKIFQADRPQLDTVLDMFSYPARWERLESHGNFNMCERIFGVVEIYENHVGDMNVKLEIDPKKNPIVYSVGRAYRAKFRCKMELLQDWREHQALIEHFKTIEEP